MKNFWEKLCQLYQKLLMAAEQEDWQNFVDLEKERQVIFSKLLKEKTPATKEDIEFIQVVMKLNKKLLKDTKVKKNEVGESILTLRRKQKKTNQYTQLD